LLFIIRGGEIGYVAISRSDFNRDGRSDNVSQRPERSRDDPGWQILAKFGGDAGGS
jgi:hypothetical protein